MKKFFRILLLGVLAAGSYGLGTWHHEGETGKDREVRGGGRVLYYVDPMNPSHTSDKPGVAPCGMPLEPVYAEEEASGGDSSQAGTPMSPGTVKVTPRKQQIIGVEVGTVEAAAETHTIRTLGRVAPDENRVYRLVSSIDGWTREITGGTTGSLVHKDELLALLEVYKNEFYTWQQQHLTYAGRFQPYGTQQPGTQSRQAPQIFRYPPQSQPSAQGQSQPAAQAQPHSHPPHDTGQMGAAAASEKEAEEVTAASPAMKMKAAESEGTEHVHSEPPQAPVAQMVPEQRSGTVSSVDYYSNRPKLELLNMGVGEKQLEELERTRQFGRYIEIRSPVTGFVLTRNVSPRQWADKGTEFFRIVDLSHVWIMADVFTREAPYIRPGASARVSLPQQGEAFEATVSEVPPQFDPATRTLKVRLEAHNPEYVLRPEMFVDVAFEITLPPAITVPVDAVLDSGLRKTVFVDLGQGFFEPRTVETGWRFDDRVEIVKGLQAGERIVVSGNFLIDSESRMKLAAAGLYGTPQKDPVCGLEVYPNKAKAAGLTGEADGKTYYFCSEDCKTQFARAREENQEKTAVLNNRQGAAGPERSKAPSVLTKDPVCGMPVSESKARARGWVIEQDGKSHFFCSRECMEQFAASPPQQMKKVAGDESRNQLSGHEGDRHD